MSEWNLNRGSTELPFFEFFGFLNKHRIINNTEKQVAKKRGYNCVVFRTAFYFIVAFLSRYLLVNTLSFFNRSLVFHPVNTLSSHEPAHSASSAASQKSSNLRFLRTARCLKRSHTEGMKTYMFIMAKCIVDEKGTHYDGKAATHTHTRTLIETNCVCFCSS